MNKTSKLLFLKVSVVSIALIGLIAALTVLAQTQKTADIDLAGKDQMSSESEQSKIVAVRRINILTEAMGSEGLPLEKRIPFVEIELFVGKIDFGTNLMHVVRIGETDFIVHDWTKSGNAILLLSPDDFAGLKDSAEVSYRIGVAEEKEKLKRQFAEGTADRIAGKSLGKLDKKMIDRQPVIDRKLNEKL